METTYYTLTAREIIVSGDGISAAVGAPARQLVCVRRPASQEEQAQDNVIDLAAWKAAREEETRLEEYIREADLVITGEGQMDGQTAMGKAPIGVAGLAKKYGKTVIAFTGATGVDAEKCNEHGIDAFFPILRNVVTLEEAMKNENAKRNLADTAEQVYRLWRAGTGSVSVF